jgi:PAS domain S-box-containing protein
MRKGDGSLFWCRLEGKALDASKPQEGVIWIAEDITASKLTKEALLQSEERFRTLFMSMSEGFYLSKVIYDDKGNPCDYRYLEVNPTFERIVGLSRDQIVGKRYKELVPVDTSHWLDIYFKVALTGTPLNYEFYSEEYHQYFETLSCRQSRDQVAVFVLNVTERKRAEAELAQHRDRLEELVKERTSALEKEIAERKQAEQRIQAALAEKEVLLREVHHRVKNNLNTIANILYFQTKTLEDKKALAAFLDSQNRIHSMARVHEHLYSSPSLTKINIVSYFKDLTVDLQQTFGSKPIAIHIDASKKHLEIDQAIPCGLIVNELVTNSLKYAFPEGTTNSRKELSVRLTTQADQHILEVRDNGVGLPAGLDVENSPSLGLRLVSMLTRQLKGQLTIDTALGQGVKFTVNFPVAITEDPNEKP